ncbi:hypothetical protein ACFL03_16110 [Thermodesulfobacteriota bacterium]
MPPRYLRRWRPTAVRRGGDCLQSLAKDRIFPFLLPFAKGAGQTDNPRRGVLLSAAIALGTIGLGQLNLIARIVSMFFLISYGLLNYATFFEARSASPSFRPRFKWFDLRLSLLGFIACFAVMMAIDLKTGIVAGSILFAIHQYLKRTAGPARWADSRRAYYLQRIRENIVAASKEPEHPRDWRPQILAFSNNPERRTRLIRFASWIEGRSGMTTVVRILEGSGAKVHRERIQVENEMKKNIMDSGLNAFPLVLVSPELDAGVNSLLQAFGIGPLKANTILLNWLHPDSPFTYRFRELLFGRHLRTVYRLGCNIVILHSEGTTWTALKDLPAEKHRIDVWWRGDTTSRMMLLLAYLMTRTEPWDAASIRVLAINYEKDSRENMEHLTTTLEEIRIEAEPRIVVQSDIRKIADISSDASLVFLPFRLKGSQMVGPVDGFIEDLLLRLQITAVVLAAEDIDLGAEPEEGVAGEMAVAMDALADIEKKAGEAEKDEVKAKEIAEIAKAKMLEAQSVSQTSEEKEHLSKLKAETDKAEKEADKAFRKAAKARAKVEETIKKVEELGTSIEK